MKYLVISYTMLYAVFFVACGNHHASKEEADLTFHHDTVVINENAPVLGQIIVQKAQLQDFSAEFRTVGTVRPVAGKLAEIAPPFAGRIVRSFVQLGQKINAGAPVFELGSSEFYEAVKAYYAAQSGNEVAQRNYSRQKELATHGVASQKDLEQAQSEASIARQELELAKASLQIFNIDVTAMSSGITVEHSDVGANNYSPTKAGQPLQVVSPIAGEVIKSNITIGSYVKEDAEPLAVVADLSKVWIAALVKEKYFGAITKGDRVEIYIDVQPRKIIWGTIYYIGEMLDEETRSLEVIVACDNATRELKLGMFCEVHFLSAPTQAIILPTTAVMQEQEGDFVFVETAKGRFVRRKVVTEMVFKQTIRIVSGIAEGERVVVEGGIYLN